MNASAYSTAALACVFLLAGCGDSSSGTANLELHSSDGLPTLANPPGPALGTPGSGELGGAVASCPSGSEPALTWNEDGQCGESRGTRLDTLPGTGVDYCVKAHPSCSNAGAGCPLVITSNTRFFDRVDEPARYGAFITVESYGPRDGQDVKDWVAELPRAMMSKYPGLDAGRIYIVGWSAGAGAVSRGLCSKSKGYDESQYGTTSDIYAAAVNYGGCVSCSDGFRPLSGNFHVFTTNGREDIFGADGCEESLSKLAATNNCSNLNASWQNVSPGDPYVPSADGTSHAQKLDYGDCAGGSVLGYRFADEAHVVSYKKHFDPKVRAADLIWQFLMGRQKVGGPTGSSPGCPAAAQN